MSAVICVSAKQGKIIVRFTHGAHFLKALHLLHYSSGLLLANEVNKKGLDVVSKLCWELPCPWRKPH